MSESRALLTETADRLFADLSADPKLGFPDIWNALEENGFPALLVAETDGGFGGDWLDAVAVLRLAAYHALAAPLGEAILARRLLADAGIAAPEGLATLAAGCEGKLANGRFSGTVKAVAWGRAATSIVTRLGDSLILLRRADAASVRESESPAGDPRDSLAFENAPAESAPAKADPFALGALTRTALIAGALDGALERSIDYANERVQFGKPIGKFQAVQQSLAVFAEEAAAVNCAAQAAARTMGRDGDNGGGAGFEIAAAKIRANIAAQAGAAIAHQVHGAIGFTREYGLHRWTRRLAAWNSEFGSERYWSELLGGAVAAGGPDSLWTEITRRSDLAAQSQ